MRSMPSGSITKAIDVWMATCLVFVFGAFIEYSIVNTLVRKEKEARDMEPTDKVSWRILCSLHATLDEWGVEGDEERKQEVEEHPK